MLRSWKGSHMSKVDTFSLPDSDPPPVVRNRWNSQLQELAPFQSHWHLANIQRLFFKAPQVVLWLLAPCQKSWQAANSTLPDPTWSLSEPYCPQVARNGLKRHISSLLWPWPLTFDLALPKISKLGPKPTFMPKIKFLGQTVLPVLRCFGRTNGTLGNIYGYEIKFRSLLVIGDTSEILSHTFPVISAHHKVSKTHGLIVQILEFYTSHLGRNGWRSFSHTFL